MRESNLGEGGEGEVVGVDLPEPVLRLVVVGGLVVPLIREAGPLRLQRLRLQLRLKGEFNIIFLGETPINFSEPRE